MTDSPIRVFAACAPNHEDAESQAVLEYTLRKHASRPVELTWMKLSHDPASPFSDVCSDNWPTPFSGLRWMIPALCNYEGKAIYMDSDMMIRADIAELWDQTFDPGCIAMVKHPGRMCVILWDCAAAKDVLPELDVIKAHPNAHGAIYNHFRQLPSLVQNFEGNWNCLEGEDFTDINDPAIKLIHYTSMPHQPHLRYAIPRLAAQGRRHWYNGKVHDHPRQDMKDLFDRLLKEAEEAGYPISQYEQDPLYGDYKKMDLSRLG